MGSLQSPLQEWPSAKSVRSLKRCGQMVSWPSLRVPCLEPFVIVILWAAIFCLQLDQRCSVVVRWEMLSFWPIMIDKNILLSDLVTNSSSARNPFCVRFSRSRGNGTTKGQSSFPSNTGLMSRSKCLVALFTNVVIEFLAVTSWKYSSPATLSPIWAAKPSLT